MSQKRVIKLVFIYLFINSIFINLSASTLFNLVGGWEKVSDPAEEYNAGDGWTTYSIESLQIAKIEILQEGDFCFASKMDSPTPNELYFNNKFIESTQEFKKSNYVHVNKNDILKWVFSVKDSKGGKVWIAFPTEQIVTGENKPPSLNSLEPDKLSPQEAGNIISWIANASDEDKDVLLYKFILNNSDRTKWINENIWIWNTTDDIGACKIGVKVRDNNHAGPDEFDDYKETNFIINPKKELKINISDLKIQQDKTSPQEVGSVITFTVASESIDLNNSIYRFILDGRPVTEWSSSRMWKWEANNAHIGVNHIGIQVKDNGTGKIYSTNLSYDIGILIRDGEDLNEAISSIHRDNVYIFIEGTHIVNDIIKINNSFIKLIGKSGNAKLVPAREFTKCAISIMNKNCDVMNITINGFHLGVKLSADNCTIKNTVFSSVGTAIHIKGSNNTSIINNILHGNDQRDTILLFVNRSNFAEILNNVLENSSDPIKLERVNNFNFKYNKINYSSTGIDIMDCTKINLINNSIMRSRSPGFSNDTYSLKIIGNCTNIKIENNTIEGKTCDDIGNLWKNNCWKNIACRGNENMSIQGCTSPRIKAFESKLKCCNGD